VLFIEVSGCLPMCGHGTIGVATVLVETGMVTVTEPETLVKLDTPAGLVEARVAVRDGRATAVTLRNVASFSAGTDLQVEVDGLGTVTYDLAFGGNFYAILPAASVGLEVDPARADELVDAGLRIIDAIETTARPVHPEDPRIAGCHHVVLHQDGTDGADAKAATSIFPGWLDRSPCGTGTSARLAQLHAAGRLGVGEAFVNESVLGTRFTGRIVEETTVAGRPAIVPEITGRAWVTGMGQYLLDPEDPFPAGFRLG
jgi:proline racemase